MDKGLTFVQRSQSIYSRQKNRVLIAPYFLKDDKHQPKCRNEVTDSGLKPTVSIHTVTPPC